MKRFHVTLMCGGCVEKITNALNKKGFCNFNLDLNTGVLEFKEDVNGIDVINTVSDIKYKIVPLKEEVKEETLTEDEIYSMYYENLYNDK